MAELQSASNAEFEEVRQEGSGFIQLLASHVREAASLADGASRRVSTVEQETAANVEEMRGRFEALATTHSEVPQLRCGPVRPNIMLCFQRSNDHVLGLFLFCFGAFLAALLRHCCAPDM